MKHENRIDKTDWTRFFRDYSVRNEGRRTRIGVFEVMNGISNDYWLEDGLPLIAIESYPDEGKTRIDVLLENYNHAIASADAVVLVNGNGDQGGLDILDAEGKTTIIRFEDWPIEDWPIEN